MGQCNEVHLFSKTQSIFASVVFDGSSTTLKSMHTSEIPEATHEAMLRALEGALSA